MPVLKMVQVRLEAPNLVTTTRAPSPRSNQLDPRIMRNASAGVPGEPSQANGVGDRWLMRTHHAKRKQLVDLEGRRVEDV